MLYAVVLLVLAAFLYIRSNDAKLASLPERAAAFSRTRWTEKNVEAMAAKVAASDEISVDEQIPPKTGRRYIVVGGVSDSSNALS